MAARYDDAAAEAAEAEEDALLRGVRAAFGAPPPRAAVLAARDEEADEEVRSLVASLVIAARLRGDVFGSGGVRKRERGPRATLTGGAAGAG